ncbi:recombination regulator RecX [Bacillus shivajii]|uniref:recombination regulator RecX n=1 Tax=Bacillus shivajii TaxID=1983719 RepID=UPI001CF9FEB5|nr:recombination regulator RecX [Bacillus shivajii]UCZ54094.1 recombination regulator RecX [Bacillus shivajii]
MPQVSKMTASKRKKGRYHIYVNRGSGEEYAVTISEDIFVKQHLKKGMELSEEDIETLRKEDTLDKAFQRALNFLSYRMRSEQEVYRYLLDQEATEEEAAQMMDRLRDLNLLDDEAFAASFVRTKKNTQKKGPYVIEQELYQKGISQRHVDNAMLEYTEEEQFDHAVSAAEKKQKSYRSDSKQQRKKKLVQFLVQRGFSQSMAQRAVEECELENDVDAEWEAIVKHGEKALKKYGKYEGWEQEQRIKQFLYGKGFSIDLIETWLKERE